MDCGRYGSHDPSVDHVISCHLNEQIAVELEALRKDLPVE
jgi:hypothetical protein